MGYTAEEGLSAHDVDELRVPTLSFIYNFISLGENLTILFFTESKCMHFLSRALRPPSNFSQHNQPPNNIPPPNHQTLFGTCDAAAPPSSTAARDVTNALPSCRHLWCLLHRV